MRQSPASLSYLFSPPSNLVTSVLCPPDLLLPSLLSFLLSSVFVSLEQDFTFMTLPVLKVIGQLFFCNDPQFGFACCLFITRLSSCIFSRDVKERCYILRASYQVVHEFNLSIFDDVHLGQLIIQCPQAFLLKISSL